MRQYRADAAAGVVALTVFVCAGAATAGLASDTNGMGAWQGSLVFQSTDSALKVEVEYCTYEPGRFDDSYTVPTEYWDSSRYYYAYQVFNDLGTVLDEWSEGYVGRLSVGLDGGDEDVADYAYLDGTGDATPTGVDLNPAAYGAVGWNFQTSPPDLGWGYMSDVLFYSSPYAPEEWIGSVSGNSNKTLMGLPSPTPEPTTTALLAAGLALVGLRRRKD